MSFLSRREPVEAVVASRNGRRRRVTRRRVCGASAHVRRAGRALRLSLIPISGSGVRDSVSFKNCAASATMARASPGVASQERIPTRSPVPRDRTHPRSCSTRDVRRSRAGCCPSSLPAIVRPPCSRSAVHVHLPSDRPLGVSAVVRKAGAVFLLRRLSRSSLPFHVFTRRGQSDYG